MAAAPPHFDRVAITTRRPVDVADAAAHAQAGADRHGTGGRAGVRLSRALGLAVSRNTLLRLRRRLPLPAFATPRQMFGRAKLDLLQQRFFLVA